VAWSIARQWDFELRGGATWFGNANGYREIWTSLTALEFW
jgi:hypothetical protein